MHRISLTTRAFLFSFVPACLVLLTSFIAISAVVHRIIKQQLGDGLRESSLLLNRVTSTYSQQHSVLTAKLTDSAGLKASVGLMAEAHRDSALMDQVRRTIELQLSELQRSSLYDFLAVTDLKGRTLAAITSPASPQVSTLPVLPSRPGLGEIQHVLYQLEFAPIDIGGETAGVLVLGKTFDIRRLPVQGDAILLEGNRIVRSTFSSQTNAAFERQLSMHCAVPTSGCEVSVAATTYVVSVLDGTQLGPGYRLLGFRSLDGPLRAFSSAFTPLFLELTAGGILLALVCTLLTSRSVSQPLRNLVGQLMASERAGEMPHKLEMESSAREVDLLVSAFNRVAKAERDTRQELRAAKDAAESANRLKTEFLTNVSHELRTPLNGVLGMTDLLLSSNLDEEQAEYGTAVRDSGRALLNLIEDILNFSELETGRLRLKPAAFNLFRVLEDVANAIQPPASAKGISVYVSSPESLPSDFIGDETRIRQVLMHLSNNAVKFTRAGFICLQIECESQNAHQARMRLEVKDTGIGIDPENRDLIFQRFTQADGSLKRRFGGTGIGLSIAKGIVELMGGQIGVESSPQIGSTFWFIVTLDLLTPTSDSDSVAGELLGARQC